MTALKLESHPINFLEQKEYIRQLDYTVQVDNFIYIIPKKRFGQGSNLPEIYPITLLIDQIASISSNSNWKDVAHLIDPEDKGLVEVSIDFPTYRIKAPWRSALAQGLYISYLIRVKAPKKEIEKSFKVLVEVKGSGGFRSANVPWYEEYPVKNSREARVLNGHLIAIVSLYEFYYFIDSKEDVINEIESSLRYLDTVLIKYDFYGWSKYCLYKNNLSNYDYHCLHIRLLEYLILYSPSDGSYKNINRILHRWKEKRGIFNKSFTFRFFVNILFIFRGVMNRVLFK